MSQWVKHPEEQYEGNVSVNGNIYTFQKGVAQVDREQDVAIFEEYLRCFVVHEEVAKSLIGEAEGEVEKVAKPKKATKPKDDLEEKG